MFSRTDYHDISNNDIAYHTIKIDDADIDYEAPSPITILCTNENKKKAKKLINKIFLNRLKYKLYFIPKFPNLKGNITYPIMNTLFGNDINPESPFLYYSRFLNSISKKRNVLFISDVLKWYKLLRKKKELISKINSIPVFWNIICFSEDRNTERYNEKISFDFLNTDHVFYREKKIDWNVAVYINSNFIKKILKNDLCTIFNLGKSNNTPCLQFKPKKYRNLNFDLYEMNNKEATSHFLKHGWLVENRRFFYPPSYKLHLPELVVTNNTKKIVLLNHSDSCTGAPLVIYNIFNQLKKSNSIDVFLLSPKFNLNLINKIGLDLGDKHMIEYMENPRFVEKCLKLIQPDVVFINSFSSSFVSLVDCFNNYNIIQYVHESFDHYIPNQLNLKIKSKLILCADHKTARKFKKKNEVTVDLLPPKFDKSHFNYILSNTKPIYSLVNLQTVYNWTIRPLIGMIGTPCDRKNFDLFKQIARVIPEYEFVWIGGEVSYKKNNFMVIKENNDIYSYLKIIDCFILTSKVDLCPVVLLESLATNTPSLIFQKNIGFRHKKSNHLNIKNKFIENIDIYDFRKLIDETIQRVKSSNPIKSGRNYIEKHFIYSNNEIENIINKII